MNNIDTLQKLKEVLPSNKERDFLIEYFTQFADAIRQRYGKVDLENLYAAKAPLFLERNSYMMAKNLHHTSLNNDLEIVREKMRLKNNELNNNFRASIEPDFKLLIEDEKSSYYKIFKVNNSYFLLEYNTLLDIRYIVHFHNEKTDYYHYQKDFIILLQHLLETFTNSSNDIKF